ncbi:MAG TPA: TolC family protein [Gemmatimonadales bacterium]|jgi:TolC family type I secretion outer membrane protein
MRRFTTAAAVLLLWIAPAWAQVPTVTLGEAVDMALRANPQMVQARGQVAVASASKREAIGNWLPSISGSSSWSRNSSSRWDDRTQTTVTGGSSSLSAGLSASMTLFDGFRTPAQNRAANAGFDAADAALVNQEFQIALQTKQTFFNALAQHDLVAVSETQIQRAEEQLKVSREKLAAGQATRSDTLRSAVELANARLQLLNAQTNRATAEASLARLIGVDGSVRAVSDANLFSEITVDTASVRAEAINNSPAVAQADANARAAQANLAVSRGQYFPTVSASYSNSYSGQQISQLGNSWSIRLSMSWPLFNGFTRETGITRSVTSRDAAIAQAEDARRSVNADLTQYLAALAAARSSIEIAIASRAAAAEDLRVQQERYRLGAATIVEVLTSQVSLDQAEVDIIRARFDYLVARAQLEALIGREL